ncbi:hypothetical protein [Vibrio parahaemolyticus]|uniref:hypothetical protein n=2 Tax=Vibrio parahaemolyticus TaxID=670 RepID=UPI00235E0EF3|nr:hypothetical protein [Vibrio parahaemolyticus]
MGFRDLGKKYVLTRTKIEFSGVRPLSSVICSYPVTMDLIQDLFEIEDDILLDVSFIKKIEKEFSDNEGLMKGVYFNFLKKTDGEIPKITSKRSFSALVLANNEFQEFLLKENKSLYLSNEITHLYIFGFYKNISIDTTLLDSKNVFIERLKVISQCNKYFAIQYMINKKEKFAPFATYENSLRAYKTILNIDVAGDKLINLLYWGLVFTALLNKDVNSKMQEYFSSLPEETYSEIKEIFFRYKDAASDIADT